MRQKLAFNAVKLGKEDPLLSNFVLEARKDDIDTLCRLLLEAPPWWQRLNPFKNRHKRGSMVVVTGIGGIGKTSLVQYAAYLDRIRNAYRERLYIDLKGMYLDEQSRRDWSAQAVLRQAMIELGMYKDKDIPEDADIDMLSRHYQNFLQDKEYLILFDNPPDTTSLRHFAPPANSSIVIIARPGGALHSITDAPQLKLKPLSEQDACAVLKQFWKKHVDQDIAKKIARLCSYVPLALVVAGGTICQQQQETDKPERVAHKFAERLEQEQGKRPGVISNFFRPFGFYDPADANRKDIQTVLKLSYALLSEPAQQLFRALATFNGLPFEQDVALTVAFGPANNRERVASDQIIDREHFESLCERGLIQSGASDDGAQTYTMYDLLFAYARFELERDQHRHEVIPCLQRYLGYYADVVATQEEQWFQSGQQNDAPVQAFAQQASHLEACFATLSEPLTDPTGARVLPDNDSRLLKLVVPALPLLTRGRQLPQCVVTDKEAIKRLFDPQTEETWRAKGQQLLASVYQQQDQPVRESFAALDICPDWFDAALAQASTAVDQTGLDALVELGLLSCHRQRRQYDLPRALRHDLPTTEFAQLPAEQQQRIREAYATYVAEHVVQKDGITPQHSKHASHGQQLAATARPPLDRPLVIYAVQAFAYFEAQQDYKTLQAWTQAGLDAAQRLEDKEQQAVLSVNLGLVLLRQGQWQEAESLFAAVYQGDLQPHALPATRARAATALGLVYEGRLNLDKAEKCLGAVYNGELEAAADAATRAAACAILGDVYLERGQWYEHNLSHTDEQGRQWFTHSPASHWLDDAKERFEQVYAGALSQAADGATRARAAVGLALVTMQQPSSDEPGSIDYLLPFMQQPDRPFRVVPEKLLREVDKGALHADALPDTCARAHVGLGTRFFKRDNLSDSNTFFSAVFLGNLSDDATPATRARAGIMLSRVMQAQNNRDAAITYARAIYQGQLTVDEPVRQRHRGKQVSHRRAPDRRSDERAANSSDEPVPAILRARAGLLLGKLRYGDLEDLWLPNARIPQHDTHLPLALIGLHRYRSSKYWDKQLNNYWCPVKAGPFWYGDDHRGADALQQVELPNDFAIARYPTTNAEFARFVAAGGYQNKDWWTDNGWQWMQTRLQATGEHQTELVLADREELWETTRPAAHLPLQQWLRTQQAADLYIGLIQRAPQFANPLQPAVFVSWYEAVAYCRWLTDQGHNDGWLPGNQEIRLPTALEWERAARGTEQWRYPWGNEPPADAERVNGRETGLHIPTPIGCFPQGKADCGAHEMLGNVWEWTATRHGHDDDRNPVDDIEPSDAMRVKGFSYYEDIPFMRSGGRNGDYGGRNDDWGFRPGCFFVVIS
ncbi:MAG: SUMF1/EgtB/PvdO family nonheme iron enzyme [Chloroflexaceae bacterium]|nr:SUMF1/EgtB/PvdO family nonheme iron enzyme [Chloroflexaceae bacterium]